MPTIRIKTNVDQFDTQMKSFESGLRNELMPLAFRGIRSLFYRFERELFESQGSKGEHGAWPALSPQYKKWKAKHYPGMPIMVLKENLKPSLTSISAGSIQTLSKTGNGWQMRFGTDIQSEDGFDYPVHHQSKAAKKRRTIDITQDQANSMAALIAREIQEMARRVTLVDMVRINNPTMRMQ